MPYIGHNPTQAGSFVLLDDIASGFDGDDVTFTLQIGGVDITPTADNLIIALDGVIQHSPEAYSVSGSTLTFTAAPASGVDFYGMLMGQSASIGQGAIGADELAVTGDGSANQMLVSDGDGTMTWKGSGLSATSATGDLIYRNSSGELARLAVGSSGQVLTVASGVPAWETDVESYLPLSGGTMSGVLNMNSQNITNGGTIVGTFSGNLTGNVTGNTSGTAASVTGASQGAITSVGTLTSLAITSSSATGLTVDVGLPSSANREIARFQAQSARPIAFGWIDSGSKMSLFTPDNHSLVLGTGAIGTNNLEITDAGAVNLSHTLYAEGNIQTSDNLIVSTSGQTDYAIDNNGGAFRVYRVGSGAGMAIDASLNTILYGTLEVQGNYLTINHSAQNGIKIKGNDTACLYIYDAADDSLSGGLTFSHDTAEFLVYTNGVSSNSEALKIASDNTATFKGSLYVTNNAPQMFLTDTDTSRYGSIYYGTRAFIFDNVMDDEALDSVDPWFEWRFATATAGTYTTALKIDYDLSATFAGRVGIDSGGYTQQQLHVGDLGTLLLSHGTDTIGEYSGIFMRSEGGEENGMLRTKGLIAFERTGAYGVGDMKFCINGDGNNTAVTNSDVAFQINSNKSSTFKGTVNIRKGSGDGDLYLYNADASQGLRIDQNSIRTTTNNGLSIFPNDTSSKGIEMHNDAAKIIMGGSSHTLSAHFAPSANDTYNLGHDGTHWATMWVEKIGMGITDSPQTRFQCVGGASAITSFDVGMGVEFGSSANYYAGIALVDSGVRSENRGFIGFKGGGSGGQGYSGIAFGTTDSSSNSTVERMSIRPNGDIYTTGVYGAGIQNDTYRDMLVRDDGLLGSNTSSRRYKEDIKDMPDTSWIYNLRPVDFKWKESDTRGWGLIAEEVEDVEKRLVTYDEDGLADSVTYSKLIPLLLKTVQEQNERIKALENA